MKIELNKKYRMINTHEEVRIVCTDRKGKHNCLGLYKEKGNEDHEFILPCDMGGMYYDKQLLEEIPETDWSKVKVDACILIYGEIARHFSHYEKGLVHCFIDGKTSHTTCYTNAANSNDVVLVG